MNGPLTAPAGMDTTGFPENSLPGATDKKLRALQLQQQQLLIQQQQQQLLAARQQLLLQQQICRSHHQHQHRHHHHLLRHNRMYGDYYLILVLCYIA